MDILSILLKTCCIILIVVFIIVGIKLINLIDESTKIVREVEKGIEIYKNKFLPILKIVDYFEELTEKTNDFIRKTFKKFKIRNEEKL